MKKLIFLIFTFLLLTGCKDITYVLEVHMCKDTQKEYVIEHDIFNYSAARNYAMDLKRDSQKYSLGYCEFYFVEYENTLLGKKETYREKLENL